MPPTKTAAAHRARAASVTPSRVRALLPTAVLGLAVAAAVAATAPNAPSAPSTPVTLGSSMPAAFHWKNNIADNFHRVVRPGFGHARVGGRYARKGRSWIAVRHDRGQIGPVAPGTSTDVTLPGVHSVNEIARVRFSVQGVPQRGYGTYVSVLLRRTDDGSAYEARLRVGAGGQMRLSIAKSVHGQESYLTGEFAVPGRLHAGQNVIVEGYVGGDASPRVGVHAWLYGHRAAPWQYMVVDQDAGPLAASTGVGVRVYQSTGSADGTVFVHTFYGWHGNPIVVDPGPSSVPSSGSSSPSAPASSPTSTAPSSTDPTSSEPASADPSSSSSAPSTSSAPSGSPVSTQPTTPAGTPPSSSSSSPAPAPAAGAGAAPLGTAQYSIPAGAVFVAPNGNDSTGNGSQSAPFATIGRAVSAAPTGGTVVLRGGRYNQSVFIGKSVTIEGYPGEVAWMDGSIPVTGWNKSGATWVHSGWTCSFDHSASFSTGSDAGGFVNPAYPMAAYPDQVFADGAQLQQVSGTPGAGQFSVNTSNSTLTVGSDPTGSAMRASNVQTALTIGAGNVTLRGFGIRNYATSLPQMGTVYLGGSTGHDLIQNVVFSNNATQAVSIDVGNVVVDHVTSADNGMTGIHANGANNLVISNSLLTGNNTQHFNPEPSAAAIKVTRLNGVTVSNNAIHDNIGVNAIWADENVTNFTIVGNQVSNNHAQYGIITELSDTGIVADNTVSGTRYGYTAFDTGDVQVYNNTFSGNSVWDIGLSQDNRYQPGMSTAGVNPTSTCPWIVKNVDVANNDLTQSVGSFAFYALDKQTNRSADSMQITLHGNLYRARTSSGPWPIGWGGSDNVTVVDYATPRDWEIAKSLPVLNGYVSGSVQTPTSISAVLVPLPASIASAIGVAPGTQHLGAF